MSISINKRAEVIARQMAEDATALNIHTHPLTNGATVIDAGINTKGSLEAGRLFAEICLGGLGQISLTRLEFGGLYLPGVTVSVSHPAIACMGSQYAGWALKVKGCNEQASFFAMASGPARALYKKESIFDKISCKEISDTAVLALESRDLPDERVALKVAEKCRVKPENVWLVVAPTASIAGSVQVAARVVETGMHKMHELGFDINQVAAGFGTCPLAFVEKKDIRAIGRTNDTVLYAGQVWYTVDTGDAAIESVIQDLPSAASKDFGSSFYDLFKRYDKDFYKIDPLLFSPAQVTVNNLKSGHTFSSGRVDLDLVRTIIMN